MKSARIDPDRTRKCRNDRGTVKASRRKIGPVNTGVQVLRDFDDHQRFPRIYRPAAHLSHLGRAGKERQGVKGRLCRNATGESRGSIPDFECHATPSLGKSFWVVEVFWAARTSCSVAGLTFAAWGGFRRFSDDLDECDARGVAGPILVQSLILMQLPKLESSGVPLDFVSRAKNSTRILIAFAWIASHDRGNLPWAVFSS